jgi:hypothetical protein
LSKLSVTKCKTAYYQRRLKAIYYNAVKYNRPWRFKPDRPAEPMSCYLASVLQCDQLLLGSNTSTDIFCPVTVSHVIALFAWVLCAKTLSSHSTLAFRWGGKATNNKAQEWLKVFTMSARLPRLKSKHPYQEGDWTAPILFLSRKTGELKQMKYRRFIWYNCHNSGYYPSSCFSFKTRRFGDWILFPSSGGTYSIGLNRHS